MDRETYPDLAVAMTASSGAAPRPAAIGHGSRIDLIDAGRVLADRIAAIAGVTAVLDAWSGFARWLGQPPVQLVHDDRHVSVCAAISVDERARVATTVAQVSEVLRSGLDEFGVRVGRLSVRVVARR